MARDDDEGMSPAAMRKLMEQAAEKANNKLARNLGYEDAEDMVEQLRSARGDTRQTQRRQPGESEAERKLRERDEADRKAADDRKKAEDAAAAKAARDQADAARAEEAKRIRDEAAAEVARFRSEAKLREDLLEMGVKRADLPWVMHRHQGAVESLPEAEKAKGVDVKSFLASVAKEAPQVFAEGRVPVVDAGDGGNSAGSGGAGAGGSGTPASTSTGHLPAGQGAGAATAKDYSKASPKEVQERLAQLASGKV